VHRPQDIIPGMSADPGIESLDKAGLFGRLAEAGARITLVTPNLRLAHEFSRQFDAFQLSHGQSLWDAPDILPFPAFVARAYDDATFSGRGADLPLLLAPGEEQALWEAILEESGESGRLLALPQAAAAARDAWKTAHEWQILDKARHCAKNEDAEAFMRWAQRYERVTRQARHTEGARLPELVASALGDARVGRPALLVRYGFDIVNPQQEAFFTALAGAGCEIAACSPSRHEASVARVRCLDARDEIRQAARWARCRLEASRDPARPVRIGIVVPDLSGERNALRRIFAQVMGGGAVQPFNISLGAPLDDYPLVNAAFLVLELAGREIAFEHASLLMRSPFIAGGESEMPARARLDVDLRRRAEPALTLERLLVLLRSNQSTTKVPVLEGNLQALAEFRKTRLFGRHSPREWGRAFSDALALVGFPGERPLDSAEYQTLKKWHAVIAQFAQIERVRAAMGYGEAVARLRRIAADTAFQPESPDVPVQVLGVLESAGCEFDHLWVMGLSAEAWPLAARPNPFLPIALQREAGIPQASADASLELDRRITQGWLAAAGEVVISHPAREADRELEPSPLIAAIPECALDLPAYPSIRDLLHASRKLERIEDAKAPAKPPGESRGGTFVIRDQAACPFRALAVHRLGSETLGVPHAGLDAMERGSLVHQVLAAAWRELETKHGLDTISEADLRRLLETAAGAAVARQKRDRPTTLSGRFGEIEKHRLARLAFDWLAHERGRGDFSVVAIERKHDIRIGGLDIRGRLDRVDETAGGERIVIDYKTGQSAVGAWLGARPDEPQLPLYLTAVEPAARAVAFAQVRAQDMKFAALVADKGLLPDARTLPDNRLKRAEQSWGEQVKAWKLELERLASAFVGGEAMVDPKPGACEYCDQKPFCRIHEREGGLGGEGRES